MPERKVKEINFKHSLEDQKIIDKKNEDFETKKASYIKEVTKFLIEKSLNENATIKFIWDPVDWVFYKWWIMTNIAMDNYWLILEFDWIHSERIKIFTHIWNHDIDINNELLKLKWQEIWIFIKEWAEKNWDIISVKAIVVKNT